MSAVAVEAARPVDRAAVEALLAVCALPIEGAAAALGAAVVARGADGAIDGCAALEFHGNDALLRSVAVAPTRRGEGIGRALVAAALAVARESCSGNVYLLTTTTPAFFAALGFETIPRAETPPAVQQSREFAALCPSSAVTMRLRQS